MNVFVLHENPDESAKALVDKHVPKMCLEAFQVANSGLHNADMGAYAFYGAGYDSHPWSVFAGKSFDHFNFVRKHAHALGREFLRRHGSRHSSHQQSLSRWTHDVLTTLSDEMGRCETVWPDIPLAMLDTYKCDDPVEAYRQYYYGEKWAQDWAVYQHAPPAEWFAGPRVRWYHEPEDL